MGFGICRSQISCSKCNNLLKIKGTTYNDGMSSSLDNYASTSGDSRANEVLEDEMKAEYNLCINQPNEYRNKLMLFPIYFI